MLITSSLYELWYKNDFEGFIENLITNDFLDKKLYEFNKKIYNFWIENFDENIVQIRSNQTHYSINKYFFSPVSGINCLEKFIKSYKSDSCWMVFKKDKNILERRESFYCDYCFSFDSTNPNFEDLENFEGNIRATPQTWMFLSKEKKFIEILKKGNIKSLITTGYDADFPKKEFEKYCYINDNMFNWKTGECFFTCEKKFKHTFPFYIIKDGLYGNLLNMAEKKFYESDDYFELDFSECECGLKWPKVKKFESHAKMKNKPEKISLEPLIGQYFIFQIVKDKNGETMLFFRNKDGMLPKEDLDYLQYFYGKLKIFENQYLIIGLDKLPFFCSIDDSVNYRILPQKIIPKKTIKLQ